MLGKLKFKKALADGILDNGEANIFIGDNKFNVFMQSVEELVTADETKAHIVSTDDFANEIVEKALIEKTKTETTFSKVDEEKTIEKEATSSTPISSEANALLTTASSFISQLTSMLSDATKTERLLQSLTSKDENTGQTYLRIPVENEAVVKNAVTLLAGIFKGIMGK